MEIHKSEFLSSKNFTLKVWKAAGLKIWYTGFEKDILIELTKSPTDHLKRVYNCRVFFRRMGAFIDTFDSALSHNKLCLMSVLFMCYVWRNLRSVMRWEMEIHKTEFLSSKNFTFEVLKAAASNVVK